MKRHIYGKEQTVPRAREADANDQWITMPSLPETSAELVATAGSAHMLTRNGQGQVQRVHSAVTPVMVNAWPFAVCARKPLRVTYAASTTKPKKYRYVPQVESHHRDSAEPH